MWSLYVTVCICKTFPGRGTTHHPDAAIAECCILLAVRWDDLAVDSGLKAQTPTDSVASFPKMRMLKLAEGGVLTRALPHGRLIAETVATYHENIAVRSFTGFQISYTFCCCMDKKRYWLAPSISSAVVRNDRSKEAVPTPQQFWKYWSSHPASFRDWSLLIPAKPSLPRYTCVKGAYLGEDIEPGAPAC